MKLSIKRPLVAAAVGAAAFGLVTTVGTGPAAASGLATVSWWHNWDGPTYAGGNGTLEPLGEVLWSEDMQADGWGTRAQLQYKDSSGHWHNTGGVCFDDTSTTGATKCDRSVAEGTPVRVHIWASKDGATRASNYSNVVDA
ncbi:hypothetical protein [Streptomyces sp. NPDC059010]|uniref:hypothetical protein n=1 Tax=Streptomyces sp. NPDC059010 TaxID=3346695 RepID=UPI0036985CE7